MTERPSATIDVNGVDARVLEAGDPADPTVVLEPRLPGAGVLVAAPDAAARRAGYHVIAPDQRGYGHSRRPTRSTRTASVNLTDDLLACSTTTARTTRVFVGHDWGALIVWDLARLHPERVRAVVGVSVPFVQWPAPPTQLMKMVYGDRFFYILYFQQVGAAESELGADAVRHRWPRCCGAPAAMGSLAGCASRVAADGGHRAS